MDTTNAVTCDEATEVKPGWLHRIISVSVIVIMNIWVFFWMTLWTLLGSLLCFPAMLAWFAVTGWPYDRILHYFIRIYGRTCIWICYPFVRVRTERFEKSNIATPCILVVNHFSFFDIIMLCRMPIFDAHICTRSWPFRMVWYSWIMRLAGYIDMERIHWDQLEADARKVVELNRFLVIFPEGHRSRDGKTARFHSGAFKLSTRLGVPVYPACIYGTRQFQPPGRWWLKPARVAMRLLEPVHPDGFKGENGHIEMRKQVKNLMVKNLEQMAGQEK